MIGKPMFSIVVCTYNRSAILRSCLDSLAEQTIPADRYEVIVVDNNSTDSTGIVATDFAQRYPHFRDITESKQGLSHARNRGWKEAVSDWVAYIDDDAKASPQYGERLLHIIEHYPFDCFGGVYTPWYKYGKPRWFKDEYASNITVQDHTGILSRGYASGGNFVIRRSLLEKFGGFQPGLGMRPDTIAYGEEALLQMQLRDAGYAIGFDPQLVGEHLVGREKLSPWWQIRSAYARGRDWEKALETKPRPRKVLGVLRSTLHDLFHDLIRKTPELSTSDYFPENWMIDVIAPVASKVGSLAGMVPPRIRNGKGFLSTLVRSAVIPRIRSKILGRVQIDTPHLRLGSEYGGWEISGAGLHGESIVYSCGVGTDASFDLSLMERYGLHIHAFDPTPASVAWVRSQDLPDRFHFHSVGIAGYDGTAVFFAPSNPDHASHSIHNRPENRGKPVSLPVRRLRTIMNELGHSHIDILKMDIEGSEYAALEDMLISGIFPAQLLVEFHHGYEMAGMLKTRAMIRRLVKHGYGIFSISPNYREFSFLRMHRPL